MVTLVSLKVRLGHTNGHFWLYTCRYSNKETIAKNSPPRLLDMASFVLETGTTSLAHTYPAATHNSTTDPMAARSAGFGATASKTRSVDDDVDVDSEIDSDATLDAAVAVA